MDLCITLILETEKESSALCVVSRLNLENSVNDIQLEKYHKGGVKAQITTHIFQSEWPLAVLDAIDIAQSFGRSWTLLGSIQEEVCMVTESFSVSGIRFAKILLLRSTDTQAHQP